MDFVRCKLLIIVGLLVAFRIYVTVACLFAGSVLPGSSWILGSLHKGCEGGTGGSLGSGHGRYFRTQGHRGLLNFVGMAFQLSYQHGGDFYDCVKTLAGGYGCYCGLNGIGQEGGKPDPVDPIDSLCKLHDDCWGFSENIPGCLPYGYYWDWYGWCYDNKTIACSQKNDECEQAYCECDKRFFESLADYLPLYGCVDKTCSKQ